MKSVLFIFSTVFIFLRLKNCFHVLYSVKIHTKFNKIYMRASAKFIQKFLNLFSANGILFLSLDKQTAATKSQKVFGSKYCRQHYFSKIHCVANINFKPVYFFTSKRFVRLHFNLHTRKYKICDPQNKETFNLCPQVNILKKLLNAKSSFFLIDLKIKLIFLL